MLLPDGSVKHVHALARATIDASGGLEFVGAVTDVTVAKEAEQKLRRSESNLAEAQRLSHTSSWAWDVRRGDFVYRSAEVFRLFGFDPEEVVSAEAIQARIPAGGHAATRRSGAPGGPTEERRTRIRLSDRSPGWIHQARPFRGPPSPRRRRRGQPNHRYAHGYHRAIRRKGTAGTGQAVHSVAHPVLDGDGEVSEILGTHMDITAPYAAREQLEQAVVALRESEQRFRDYAETASDWLWETGPDHRVTHLSEQTSAAGILASGMIGLYRWEIGSDVESEPEKWRQHRATLDAHLPFRDLVYRTVNRTGSPIYVRTSGKPFFDVNGRFLGYRGVSTDITATIRADQAEQALRKAQAELAHVTRVTTLGELTASIAHEINQPLAAIVANADACLSWLDRETPDLDAARRSVEWIVDDSNRASEVIRRVRALAQKTEIERVPLDINDVVREGVALVQRELASNQVSLRMDLAPALPIILGDRVQLQQVIINLVMNGIEAMQSVADRPRELEMRSGQDDMRRVFLTVTDCGVGISSEDADRMFSPFFTTKSGGMGMGLSICRSIVEAHEGRLSVSRNEGPGATFRFVLPLHQEETS